MGAAYALVSVRCASQGGSAPRPHHANRDGDYGDAAAADYRRDCGLHQRRGSAAGTAWAAHPDFAGLPASLLPSAECPHSRNLLLGVDFNLRAAGIFLVLDAANSDWAVARH